MRLHAMLFAVGQVPLVGISRTTKTDTFCSEFSIPHQGLQSNELSGRWLIEQTKKILNGESVITDHATKRLIAEQAARAYFDRMAKDVFKSELLVHEEFETKPFSLSDSIA